MMVVRQAELKIKVEGSVLQYNSINEKQFLASY
jgi:hypothetical protein